MKYLTQRQIDEAHYIPGNHARTAYILHGEHATFDHDADTVRTATIAAGESPAFADAYRAWYLSSCKAVLTALVDGRNPSEETYPRFAFTG